MKNLSNYKYHYIRCDCHHPEHNLIFTYDKRDKKDGFNELYLDVHLMKQPLWKRIKYAFKYILGHQSNYGAYCEVLMNEQQVADLEDFLMEYRNGPIER